MTPSLLFMSLFKLTRYSIFEKLHDLLVNCSNAFNIICATETWSTDKDFKNNSNFHLPNETLYIKKEKLAKKRWHWNIIKE